MRLPNDADSSLSKLRDGLIKSLNAVDNSTTYKGWQDFYLTMRAIIVTHTPYDSTTWINAPDFDRARQTSQSNDCLGCPDHPDHLATADAAYAITIGMASPWSRAFFVDYPIGRADPRYPVNLNPGEYGVKKNLFMAYGDTVKKLTGVDEYAAWPVFWENCFWRDYFRTT
jgi:hypothetical protein